MGLVKVDIHNFVATMVSTVFFEVLLRSGFFLFGHLVPMIVGYALAPFLFEVDRKLLEVCSGTEHLSVFLLNE